MASPFAVFRRNQRMILAIVGIGAMVAFVFLDPLTRYIGGGPVIENPVIVQTAYGDLTERDLAGMRQNRQLVETFLRMLTAETVQAQVQRGNIDGRMANLAAEQYFGNWKQQLLDRSKPGPEASAVETYVLARKAQDMGVVVSDRAINDLLKQITADSLPKETILAIVNHLQAGRGRVSVARLFDGIRNEMLASKLSQMFATSLRDVPPAQRFEYYERLNRRAKAEIMPLPVADFASQVPDPASADVQKFYDEYKERFADPNSPDPGFKEPRRAAFQYFKADFAKFEAEAKPTITDEEIATYYERNKAQFRDMSMDDKPAEESSDPENKSESGETPAITPAEKNPEDPAPVPPIDQPARIDRGRSPMRLVSFETQEAQAPQTSPALDVPANQPAAEPPAETKSTDEPAAESTDSSPTQEMEIKYEPLEKVADTIRDTLASQKAREKMGLVLDELFAKMKAYADDLDTYNVRKETNSSLVAPRPLDMAELAKANNLEAKELPLVTASDAENEDIGKVFRVVEDRRNQMGFRSESFAEFAFSESVPIYKPHIAQDGEGNNYLFWKTDEKAAYVPELDAIKAEVTKAWKQVQARELARKRAEEYAAQARTAKKPLAEVFADNDKLKVTETPWFSWLTEGNVPLDAFSSQPRISSVEGAERVGSQFMETTFGLAPGDIGVATNHPQDTAYVVRLAEYQRTDEELRKDFAIEPAMRYMNVAITDQRTVYVAWLDDMNKQAKVNWLKPADAGDRRMFSQDLPLEEDF